MTRRAYVHRLSTRGPDDIAALDAMIEAGQIDARGIVAILGKTEGNGCVNDFTRGFASSTLKAMLGRHLPKADAEAVCIVMSGGTEGGLSPHITVFESRQVDAAPEPGALAIGRARTPDMPFEHLGRIEQVDLVAASVRAAMQDAGITDPAAVHFAQIKCPLLTLERVAKVEGRGLGTATRDPLKSMSLSRAASSLGTAVALGEVDRAQLSNDSIGRDWSLYSSRASASAGVELIDHEIVILGEAPGWSGPLRIAHAVMNDQIDVDPVREALAGLGLAGGGQLAREKRQRLVALLAKADAGVSGQLRGHRHTMLDDSDIASTRHARGFGAGALAGVVGHAEL
jgi:cyanuric acid amidohydrolase